MFEKWRIKEHMEVTDATGRHVGTVDSVDGDLIKLTRTDSPDGRHHHLDMECVERISGDRVELKDGVVLPDDLQATDGLRGDVQTGSVQTGNARTGGVQDGGVQTDSYAGTAATTTKTGTREDSPIFGTSGHGTGMGGSGPV